MSFMLRQINIDNNPYVGIFCKASEEICILPTNVSSKIQSIIKEALDVKIATTSICNTSLIGPMIALNSRSLVTTDLAHEYELARLKKYVDIGVVSETFNAIGNNVLVNDRHALVHPQLSKKTIKAIEDILDVEVVKGTIAGMKTVGSVAVVTNNGLLTHPKTMEEELEILKALFKVPVYFGTVNFGTPFIASGLVANSKGAITGTKTTGIEMARIKEALGFI